MSDYQPLTDEQAKEIARNYFDKYQPKTVPQSNPAMVIVGGQSGAGKTGAATIAKAQLKKQGGYIHVDADRMRERIATQGKVYPSHVTQPDAGRLANAVRALAMEARVNVLEEGTLKDPSGTAKWVERTRQEQGYRVELMAQATPYEVSKANIYKRYEEQHFLGKENPRMVPMSVHEQGYSGFAETAKNNGIFDRVQVRNCEGEIIFDSQSVAQSRYTDAEHALNAGRTLTPQRQAMAQENIQVALEDGQSRAGVDAEYLRGLEAAADEIANSRGTNSTGRLQA